MVLRTAIAPVLWGTTYLVTTEFLPPSPMWIAALRALPAGLLLLALRPGLPGAAWFGRLLVLGTLNIGAFFALLFIAATRLPGGVAATLGAAQVVVVLGLAALWLREPLTPREVAIAVAGVAGVALLVLRGGQALDAIGVLAGLGTAVSLGAGIVLTRKWGAPTAAGGAPLPALAATAWRSFEAYPIITQVVGAGQTRVPLTAEQSLDLDAMAAAITGKTRLAFVCTPNNPTGTALTKPELDRFLDSVPEDVLVVIDEAYREFVDDPAVPDGVDVAKEQWARGRDNVAVLRTFSKAYGLAGLRVGYLVAPGAVTEAVRKVFVPFGVNALAQVAALASLDAEDELLARCRDIVAERGRVRSALLAAGFTVPESQANFVWLPLGERTAAFNEHCLENRVVVRAFVGDGARVTIGTPEENDLFLAAAKSF